MFIPPHPRLLLSAVAAAVSLASWGLSPTAARSPKPLTDIAFERLTDACAEALTARLPSRRAVKVTGEGRVEPLGANTFRLLSSYESGGARTAFACEAIAAGGSYEVASLTLVQW
jgi:hypothetical protein